MDTMNYQPRISGPIGFRDSRNPCCLANSGWPRRNERISMTTHVIYLIPDPQTLSAPIGRKYFYGDKTGHTSLSSILPAAVDHPNVFGHFRGFYVNTRCKGLKRHGDLDQWLRKGLTCCDRSCPITFHALVNGSLHHRSANIPIDNSIPLYRAPRHPFSTHLHQFHLKIPIPRNWNLVTQLTPPSPRATYIKITVLSPEASIRFNVYLPTHTLQLKLPPTLPKCENSSRCARGSPAPTIIQRTTASSTERLATIPRT